MAFLSEDFGQSLNRRRESCRGFTLVEVVVGLVLLATLLVGVLQAYGAHHRQLKLSKDRLVATQIADDMLATWSGRPEGVPDRGRGAIILHPGWRWQTQPTARRSVAGLPVDIIRFDILSFAEKPAQPRLLSSVEVVRPVESSNPRRIR